jgi:caffeoyl-CoA O-methyltransferase
MPTYNEALSEYIIGTFAREDEVLRTIRERIPDLGLPGLMISPEEGAFLCLMAAVSGAKNAVEIGTLGGYSGVWIARGLAPGGTLTTIDINPKHAAVAREHFELAGLGSMVKVVEGEALEVLPQLRGSGPFDFIFIDADKGSMLDYLDWSLANLPTGGILSAHNAFAFGGKVVESSSTEDSIRKVREFNRRVAAEPDLIGTVFPAGDGVLTAYRWR